jgi:hypothetical protein
MLLWRKAERQEVVEIITWEVGGVEMRGGGLVPADVVGRPPRRRSRRCGGRG